MHDPKFTPAPWTIEDDGIINECGWPIAFIPQPVDFSGFGDVSPSEELEMKAECQANIHLIATAPDMYAVLEAISNDSVLQAGFSPSELASIDALLAKARGEVQ